MTVILSNNWEMAEEQSVVIIDAIEVTKVVKELYGLTGKVSNLGSCQDINFKFIVEGDVQGKPNNYVVKFTNKSQCTIREIEFQHAVISYLQICRECADFALPIPLKKAEKSENEFISCVNVSGSVYFVRLLKFVEGDILSDYKYFSPVVLHSFGAFVATITLSLVDFKDTLADNQELLSVADREIEW